jgi:hypothetical protein
VSNGVFNPKGMELGKYTLTYTVEDAFGASNLAEFTVTVYALPARLFVQKPNLFAPTEIGSDSRTQRIRIENRGGLPVKRIRVFTVGSARRDFRVVQPQLRILGPGAGTTFRATFSPRFEGTRKVRVIVKSDVAPVTTWLEGLGESNIDEIRDPDRLKPRP